jgi:hypothetical protein
LALKSVFGEQAIECGLRSDCEPLNSTEVFVPCSFRSGRRRGDAGAWGRPPVRAPSWLRGRGSSRSRWNFYRRRRTCCVGLVPVSR